MKNLYPIGLALVFTFFTFQPAFPQDSEPTKTYALEGWKIVAGQELVEDDEARSQAFKALSNHLQRIKYVVPNPRLKQLQALPIYIDLNYKALQGMQYHPSRGWLKQNNHPARLAKHVHIPQAGELIKRQQWEKHPYVVLHELAHAYHDQVLGFDHPEIKACFEAAKKKGIYEKVLAHTGRKVKHYALTNEKEYFAEMTEAFFGVNDFYPFVRAELKQHDPRMHSLLSKIWLENK